MIKVAIYARVSTKDKRQDVENQLIQLRDFATGQGWELFREYIDRESGGTSDRPEFQSLFDAASKRRFQVVLFWSLDRFSREGTFATLQHLNRLSIYGVGFRSFTEPYLDSLGVWKDMIISVLSAIARQERLRLSERTKAGLERARRQGKILGRPRIQVNADHIKALRSGGFSWAAIAQQTGISRTSAQRALVVKP